ncbi:MAG: VC0807 family protein [Acidimicrobiales bacterium]
MEPSVHDEVARGLREHSAKKGLPFSILITLVEIGGSIGLFQLAERLGASDVASYLIGSIAPVVGGLAVWARARKLSGASAAIFAFTALSAVVAIAGNSSPKVLLYKDCATTALIGLIFLGSSVVSRRPVVFYLAQRYGTDGTHEGMSIFETMWDIYGDFRTGMYVINSLWAALYLVQAAGTALIVRQTAYATAYDYDQALPFVATALGIVGSIAIGRYFAKRGKARGASALSAASSPDPSITRTAGTVQPADPPRPSPIP